MKHSMENSPCSVFLTHQTQHKSNFLIFLHLLSQGVSTRFYTMVKQEHWSLTETSQLCFPNLHRHHLPSNSIMHFLNSWYFFLPNILVRDFFISIKKDMNELTILLTFGEYSEMTHLNVWMCSSYWSLCLPCFHSLMHGQGRWLRSACNMTFITSANWAREWPLSKRWLIVSVLSDFQLPYNLGGWL